MNPFAGMNYLIEDSAKLIGRARELQYIRERVVSFNNLLLMGVEGVGKSSLLHSALTLDFRCRAARENHILVTKPFNFPVQLDCDRVFPFLTDQIISALYAIEDDETRQGIQRKIADEMARYADPSSMLSGVTTMLYERMGYRIVFVIDNFERFTTSTEVTMNHHELLRDLLEKGHLRFVAATNTDITKDSLPRGIRGSYLLQKFGGTECLIKNLQKSDLPKFLQPGLIEFGLEKEQMKAICEKVYAWSGGVPGLIILTAGQVYDQLEEEPFVQWSDKTWDDLENRVYQKAQLLLKHWCGTLSEPMVKALEQVSGNNGHCNDIGTTDMLRMRGLILRSPEGGGLYFFVSSLLKRYVDENNLTITDLKLSEPRAIPSAMDLNRLHELAKMLSDSIERQAKLEERVAASSASEPSNISKADEQTIDTIYEQYRRDNPTELPDELVESLGEYCINDLKQALLLRELGKEPEMGDMQRPALICYCVALERRLRDCFFDLFVTYADFSQMNIVSVSNRQIGAFLTLIRNACTKLADVCRECGYPQYDTYWWKDLRDELDRGCNLRNPVAHPDVIVSEALPKMHQLLLDPEDGLLSKLAIGKILFAKLCGGARQATYHDQYTLPGRTVKFQCVTLKEGGGIGGILREERLRASISPKKVKDARNTVWLESPQPTEGCCFDVRIESFDTQSKLFIVTPCSVPEWTD